MAEIRTVTTLRRKRDEISASIRLYERQLAQARADLAHITAAIRIFEASGDAAGMVRYVDTHRLFKYREKATLCRVALAKGPMAAPAHALVQGLDAPCQAQRIATRFQCVRCWLYCMENPHRNAIATRSPQTVLEVALHSALEEHRFRERAECTAAALLDGSLMPDAVFQRKYPRASGRDAKIF
jgi:hypothetical protein